MIRAVLLVVYGALILIHADAALFSGAVADKLARGVLCVVAVMLALDVISRRR